VLANRTYPTIVKLVPTYFNTDNPAALRELEQANKLPAECITQCRWLKQPKAWSQNQIRAHLEIVFTDIPSANKAIRNGIAADGCTLLMRKKLTEPEKCTKCQTFTAAHCGQACWKPIQCARCLSSHWTSKCDADEVQCINCKRAGHSGADLAHQASDRMCPVYLQHMEKKHRTHPENKYRYYLNSNDSWTWVLANWTPIDDPNQWYASSANATHRTVPNPPGPWLPPNRHPTEPTI
jgi:hypothetical protein